MLNKDYIIFKGNGLYCVLDEENKIELKKSNQPLTVESIYKGKFEDNVQVIASKLAVGTVLYELTNPKSYITKNMDMPLSKKKNNGVNLPMKK